MDPNSGPQTAALASPGWRAILDAVPAGIFETDADGRCTFVNRRWQAYAGLPAESALGYGWVQAIHPADRDELVAAWEAAVADGRELSVEFRILRPDGTTMWVAGNASPVTTDGRVTGYLGTVTDVNQVVADRNTQAEERRFVDAVLEIAGALVCVFDGEGRIIRFNRASELVTGYSFEEVRGRPFYEFLVPASEIPAVREDLAQLRPGQLPTQNENHWITRDGRLRLIAWSDVCFFDDEGHATHLISTGIDVTDERRAQEAMRGVEAVGALLAKTGPTAKSMTAVLETLSGRMGYPYLSLFIRRGPGLVLGAAVGYDGHAADLDPTIGIIARAVRGGRSAFLERGAEAGPDWRPASPDIESQIAVPLIVEGETIGALSIESTHEVPLTPADLRLVETVADRLSVALVLGREQQALLERARLFASLNEFAQAAGALVDEDLLASALLDRIADVVPHDASWLVLADPESHRFEIRGVRGSGVDALAVGREVVPGHGPAGRAIERCALVVERARTTRSREGRSSPWRAESGAIVAIPLIHNAAVLGAVVVGRYGGDGEFTELEREVLALLGAQAALAAANANLLAEVRALAIRDPLTGLFNRRHFDAAVEHIFARWRRDRADARPIAAIMFDLDQFGRLNNRYGHQAGDAVLKEFAGILLTRFRSADLVARYGGEEFVVILEGSTVADAAMVAEDIRRDLESRVVPGPGHQEVRTTVSAGCAEIDPSNPTKEALIESADSALFAAKRAGRNRVLRR